MKKVESDFMRLQDRFIGLINRSDGINLMKIKLPSPATKYVKFSAFEMFGVNAAHERRHLFQAKKTLSVIRGNNS